MNFQDLDLPPSLLAAIASIDYVELTPIQEKAIPIALAGRDILASSHTGSGKTAAFSIPLLAKLMNSKEDTALILTPTRELATQVITVIRSLLPHQHTKLSTALLIGGDPIGKQYSQLRSNPRIVVGTPGRVNDHLKRKTLKLHTTKFLVLDETDRMLDMGFSIQLETITEQLPRERQTLLFSATISKQIEQLSRKYLHDYEFIKVGEDRAVAPNIKQENVNVPDANKYSILLEELDKRTGSILVFVKTKYSAQSLATRLSKDNHLASPIHGDLKQRQRDRVMKSFRNKEHRIMVATDIAARGLDFDHIEHVINYDPPQLATDYIHRIGRTARAGRGGESLNFVSEKDRKKWQEIKKMLAGGEPPELDMNQRSRDGSRGGSGRFQRGQRNTTGHSARPRSFDRPREDRNSTGHSPRPRSFDRPREDRNSTGHSARPRSFDRPREDRNGTGYSARPRSFDRPREGGNRSSDRNSPRSTQGYSNNAKKPWGPPRRKPTI